jgi:dihydroneopterin aldolase
MKRATKRELQLVIELCLDEEINKKMSKMENYDFIMEELKELYEGTDYNYIESVNKKIYNLLNDS